MTVAIPRSDDLRPDLLDLLDRVGTSTLGHRRDHGFITHLTPIRRPIRLRGPAFTVRIGEYSASALAEAVDRFPYGAVLVLSQPGTGSRASIGGIVGSRFAALGAAGLVIDGAITDYDQLAGLDIPVYYRSVSPRTTRRLPEAEGGVQVPVSVGESVVSPGDVVFGDSDGIAVLDPAEALTVATDLAEREQREAEILRQVWSDDRRRPDNSPSPENARKNA